MPTSDVAVERKVLNVGGNSKAIAIPERFDGWTHHLLDIDPRGAPDICCDARELPTQAAGVYDAIYCSHNLEHYFAHDVPKVLAGFHHVLNADGFAEIRVPDILALMHVVVEKKIDIVDVLYTSKAGPITVRDVLYGYGREIERSGHDFYAHKTGFSPKSMQQALGQAQFAASLIMRGNLEIRAYAFKQQPSVERLTALGLPVRKQGSQSQAGAKQPG